jgi:tetratricopeptide (TPR) repeat protein
MQQAHLTIAEVTRRYNLEMRRLNKHAISLNRMYRMTCDYTQVPEDITRRKVLARVFQVSPVLLGVVSVQEVLLKPGAKPIVALPTILKRAIVDLEQQESLVKYLWHISYTSTGQIDEGATQQLEALEQGSTGRAQWKARELLYSHHRLGAWVTRGQGNFAGAVRHADQAIALAESMEDEELVSAAWYARGYSNVVWGEIWKVGEQGILLPNPRKIAEAITDFDHALQHHPRPQLAGNILTVQSRAYSVLKDQDPLSVTKARTNMERAANVLGKDTINDPYMRILLDGSPNGFNEGMYRLKRAVILNGLGRGEDALDELDRLVALDGKQGIARNQARTNAWSLIIRASASFKRGDYFSAAQEARNALLVCQDIDSGANIMLIRDIYARLIKVGYKHELIEELGRDLATYFSVEKKPK